MKLPELKEGELYAGAIINPDGTGHHIILLPGEQKNIEWNAAMEWAKSLDVDLPDHVEQALFYQKLSEQFQQGWYWSNTQHEVLSDFALLQDFLTGHQDYLHKSWEGRARAVRRIAIDKE